MDGVSAAASVLALVETTSKLVEYLRAVKNAEREVDELKRELSVFYSLLTHISDLESRVRESTTAAQESWTNAIRTLRAENGALAEYSRTLATWRSAKKDVQELLGKMGRLKLAITLIVTSTRRSS